MKILVLAFFGLVSLNSYAAPIEANKETVSKFLKLVGSDESKEIVKNGHLPSLLADDVWGRVNPAGIFTGQEGTIEYFLGLGGAMNVPNTAVDHVDIQTLIAEGDEVYAHFVVAWKKVKENVIDTQLALDARFKMTEDGKIQSYDLNAINLGKGMDKKLSEHKFLAKVGICTQIVKNCTGENEVYKNLLDCVAFMHTIPFGTYHEAQSNSFVCRSIHAGLAEYRPAMHCPHVSRDGGHKCVDVPYDSYFDFNLTTPPPQDPSHAQH